MLLRKFQQRMLVAVPWNEIPVGFQERLYLLQTGQPFAVGQPTTAVDPFCRIRTRQAQLSQTQAVGLSRMLLFCQAIADPLRYVGPTPAAPFFSRPGVHC
ncbi:hypothetical protein EG494_23525 [Salmonella enterica]|nr:hypothetical protein [Salmonella enterica]